MKPVLAVLLAAFLAGCGADGPPIPPNDEDWPEPGITITGSAEVGVVGGSGGPTQTVARITD